MERAAVLALVVDAIATGSTTNTVNLIHFIVVLFLWFRVVIYGGPRVAGAGELHAWW